MENDFKNNLFSLDLKFKVRMDINCRDIKKQAHCQRKWLEEYVKTCFKEMEVPKNQVMA